MPWPVHGLPTYVSFTRYEEGGTACASVALAALALLNRSVAAFFRKRRLVEEVAGKSGIVAASVVKKLRSAAAVVILAHLHRRPHAVFQLVVRIHRDIIVALVR